MGPGATVGILGTKVPRLACLWAATRSYKRPGTAELIDQLLNTQTNTATAGALSGNMQELRTIVAETMQRVFGGADVDTELERAATLGTEIDAFYIRH